MTKKQIMWVLGFIVALSGVYTAYDTIRPYPTRSEHNKVAGRSCENQINSIKAELRFVERDIETAKANENAAWLQTLQEQQDALLFDLDRVMKECGWK